MKKKNFKVLFLFIFIFVPRLSFGMEYLEKVPMFFPELVWEYKYPIMAVFLMRGFYVYNQYKKQLYDAVPEMHRILNTGKRESIIPKAVYQHIEKAEEICQEKYGKIYSIVPVIQIIKKEQMFSDGCINIQGRRDAQEAILGIEEWVLKDFTEEEIGAVVYHEMCHLINNDSVRTMRFKALFPSALLFCALAGYKIGQSTALISSPDVFVLTYCLGGLIECAWARRKETEADKGVMQTKDQNIIQSFKSGLEKLEKKVDKETFFPIPTLLSPVPSFKQRIAACNRALEELRTADRC